MNENIRQLHNNDRKVLAMHFASKKFNDKMVFDFCTHNKIPITDAGSVEDFIYQMDYDRRITKAMPLILSEIAKMKYNSEYISEQEFKDIVKHNDDISLKIAKIIEDCDIEYREIGLLQSLSGDITHIMQDAERRVSNMCALVLAEMAQEKLGDPLTVKCLAGERTQIADRKAKMKETEVDGK